MKRVLALVLSLGLLGILAAPAAAAPPAQDLLNDIPVTGTLADGGTFDGVLSITNLALEEGQLVASGVLSGTATQGGVVTEITQSFTDVALGLLSNGAECDILTLDLGPLFLDLLGLQVDLAPVELDVTAVPGPGNLLGNLLCAVAGLLDGQGGLGAALNSLLGIVNRLLG